MVGAGWGDAPASAGMPGNAGNHLKLSKAWDRFSPRAHHEGPALPTP